MVCQAENSGNYLIRSDYKFHLEDSMGVDDAGAHKQIYNRLWILQLPGKIKISIWCPLLNYIPTYVNPYNKRVALHMQSLNVALRK